VFTEGQYKTVIDTTNDPEVRETAFRSRVRWLRGFDYDGPYIPQIARMITEFGKLGVVERRINPHAGDPNEPFPDVMYVESRPTVPVDEDVLEKAHEQRAHVRVNPQWRAVRFGHTRRR
jgi:hypothetical protein